MQRDELFPFLRDLSAAGRAEMAALPATNATPRRVLLCRGAQCGGAYLVLQGALRTFYFAEDGREATLYDVRSGETCVLALGATLEGRPYPAWVQAGRAGASFVRVPDGVFARLLEREPAFRRFVLSALSDRIFDLMTSMEERSTRTIVERVARYVVDHAVRGDLAITQAGLAAELGTAREVVFRALAALEQQRVLRKRRGGVIVLDTDALRAVAGGRRRRG